MLAHLFTAARILHIAAGAVALATFWLPLVSKKGGVTHRRAGWLYVGASAVIAVTGVVSVVSCVAWLTDARPDNDAFAVFLLYVAVLAASSADNGIRALRAKSRATPRRALRDLALPSLLVAGGGALAVFGATRSAVLFVVFAILGAILGVTQLRFALRAPKTNKEWFFQHMSGMGASCITTITAFLVVNASRFGLGAGNLFVWVAPGVVLGTGLTLWQRFYRRRFAARAMTPAE
jgi:hypothetical protein